MKPLNLGLRFVLELCMLVALGIWGFSENFVLGFVAPLAAAVVWGLWIAPKASPRLDDPMRLALELLLFGSAGAALAAAGHAARGRDLPGRGRPERGADARLAAARHRDLGATLPA